MPWFNGDYPPSYKNQPVKVREKAVEIANALLEDGAEEGIAIATGLKQARLFFKKEEMKLLIIIVTLFAGKLGQKFFTSQRLTHHPGMDFLFSFQTHTKNQTILIKRGLPDKRSSFAMNKEIYTIKVA